MRKPVLKIKRLYKKATIPQQMTLGSCGFDVSIIDDVNIFPHNRVACHTGLAMAIPKGYHGELHIRSSLGIKGIRLANCTGIIDSDYRGEIICVLQNDNDTTLHLKEGARIAQLLLYKDPAFNIKVVDVLDKTDRNEGGFGSTNNIQIENKGEDK